MTVGGHSHALLWAEINVAAAYKNRNCLLATTEDPPRTSLHPQLIVHEQVIATTDVPPGYTVKAFDRGFFIDDEERAQIWMVLPVVVVC